MVNFSYMLRASRPTCVETKGGPVRRVRVCLLASVYRHLGSSLPPPICSEMGAKEEKKMKEEGFKSHEFTHGWHCGELAS